MSPICAAPGCENVVLRQNRRGRPPRYCSPACRPAAKAPLRRLLVEVDHAPTTDQSRPLGRIWLVRLRRGQRSVVIASELGRPSADHLANQIRELLSTKTRGGAIE
jgi:hypothetical protein